MVAHFVRLKLALMGNTLKRSVWQTIGLAIAMLYALGLVTGLVVTAIVGGGSDLALTGHAVVVAGSLVVLGWCLVPIFAFGVDPTLDPQRFSTFAIERRTLLTGLAAAGVVSVPGMTTVLAAGGVAFAWWPKPWLIPVAVLGGALAVATCVVGSRAVTTALAPLLESRRYREVLAVLALIPIVLIGPAVAWLTSGVSETDRTGNGATISMAADGTVLAEMLVKLGELAAWTPFGAAWSLPNTLSEGEWGVAAARLAVALVTLGALWLLWDRSLAKALVTPAVGGGKGAKGKGLGWFDRVPATPMGAVAARCATYWVRDPRYSAGISIILLMPVILWVPANASGNLELLLLAGPVVAWVLAFSVSNEVGYDYTAFALHVATGVSGKADRWGRALPVLIFGTVLTVAVAIAGIWLSGRWDVAAPVLGICFGTIGLTLGVSSAASARLVYPVPKPGESPLKSPQGAAMATFAAQTVTMLVVLALSLPIIITGIWAVASGNPLVGWLVLVVSLVEGVVILVAGVRMGARIYDRRAPELLQQVQAFP